MVVARLTYLVLDRFDFQYTTKEASEYMARPREHHWGLLKIIARYLTDAPRAIQNFRWHTTISNVTGMSDSDWAGDQESRKSTSGVLCKLGFFIIKCWSSTQQIIAFSSAEAGIYALHKCACQTIGIVNMARDFGMTLNATVHADASAALAISQRQGLGELRHIDVHWLWIQEKVKIGAITVRKVLGKDNPTDLMTKHLTNDEIHKHLAARDLHIASGRASKSFTINALNQGATRVAEDRWVIDSQCIIKVHEVPRRSWFRPYQAKGAPGLSNFTSPRITHAKFADGETFMRRDNWVCKTEVDLDMGRPWTGRTVFISRVSTMWGTPQTN